jgi:hypothetical protein
LETKKGTENDDDDESMASASATRTMNIKDFNDIFKHVSYILVRRSLERAIF